MDVVLAKGYRVVPQLLPPILYPSGGNRYLRLRENKGNLKILNEDGTRRVVAKEKVLFVGNVDDQGDDESIDGSSRTSWSTMTKSGGGGRLCERTIEERLRQAFRGCGDIEHVKISRAETDVSSLASPAGKKPIGSRLAHICFSSSDGVQEALSLVEILSGVGDDLEEAEVDDTVERNRRIGNVDENGDVTYGLAAFLQRHRRLVPPREDLLAEVDAVMKRFEEAEAEEAAKRRDMLHKGVDDDGFTMVMYKKKRGHAGDTPPVAKGDDSAMSQGGRGKKRKGAGALPDFYRFQMRESKREHLAKLREKFEKDKARVAKMKEQRKFKPF